MKRFSRACQQLESVPFHRDKAQILGVYLKEASERDASWALYLLLGGQLPRLIAPEALQKRLLAHSGLPQWLIDECREHAGDLAETMALLGELHRDPQEAEPEPERSLAEWIEGRLLSQVSLPPHAVLQWWNTLSIDVSWAVHALALGRFPARVSRRMAEEALKHALGPAAGASLDQRLAALPLRELRGGTSASACSQLDLFAH